MRISPALLLTFTLAIFFTIFGSGAVRSKPVISGETPGPANDAVAPVQPATAPRRPRVFVHYSTQAGNGRQVAAEAALLLESRGYDVIGIRRVGFAISTGRVRYFFAEDKPIAEQIAAHLDRYLARATDVRSAVAVQDYTRFRPLPSPGTIETWIATGTTFRSGE